MYFTDTLRGLWRRWYIVLPGMLIAAALAVGAWNLIPPGYERSSTLLLIPGAGSIPAGANPYLFLGGLAPAADVLVRAVGSENLLKEVVAENPGAKVVVSRDTTTAGPVILIVVTAPSNAAAADVLEVLLYRTATELDDIQKTEGIATENRMTVMPVTVDNHSVLQERNRFLAVGAAGLVGLALTLLVAGLVDGSSLHRKRGENVAGGTAEGAQSPNGTLDPADVTNSASTPLIPGTARASAASRETESPTEPSASRDQPRDVSTQDASEPTLVNPR